VKKIIVFLAITAFAMASAGCDKANSGTKAEAMTYVDSLQILLQEAGLVKAELSLRYEMAVPDSSQAQMAQWITATVAAATPKSTAGEYEDQEDVVGKVAKEGQKVFAKRVMYPFLAFIPITPDGSGTWEWVEYKDLGPQKKKVFDFLNR
jgi:hypothetical protein